MRPSDQIAIVGWNGESLDVLSGWTSSMEQASKAMVTAIERPAGGLHRQSERRSFGVTLDPAAQAHSARQQRHNPLRLGTQERMFGGLLIDQLEGTVSAVTSAMLGLDSPPGRRVLILLSGGWPMDVTNSIGRNTAGTIDEPNIPSGAELYGPIAKTANLLGYTIYAIDIPGMQQGRNVDASQRFATPTSVASTSMFLENELHRSLGFLAAETGGMALINAGRISALADAGADVRTFYRIGFSPTWTGDDERHDIRVEVANDELMVRARSSFFDLSPATKVGLVLESALLMGLDDEATGLKVEIGDIEPAGRGIVIADVTIVLPATNLVAVQTADGWLMQASLVMVAIDNRGNRSEVPAMPLAFITASKPRPETLIRYKTRLKLRNRTTKLAVALHDTVGGETFARVVTKE